MSEPRWISEGDAEELLKKHQIVEFGDCLSVKDDKGTDLVFIFNCRDVKGLTAEKEVSCFSISAILEAPNGEVYLLLDIDITYEEKIYEIRLAFLMKELIPVLAGIANSSALYLLHAELAADYPTVMNAEELKEVASSGVLAYYNQAVFSDIQKYINWFIEIEARKLFNAGNILN